MILRVTAGFKDKKHDSVQRMPGMYLDVSEERANELIAAKVALPIQVLNLNGTEAEQGDPVDDDKEVKEADYVALEDLTVPELLEIAEKAGVEVPKKAKKADLIDLLK